LLDLVHGDNATVHFLRNTLQRVCLPVLRDIRQWRNPTVFLGENLFREALPQYPSSIVFADASAPCLYALIEELPHDDSVVVLCTTPEALVADAKVRHLHERFGVDMLFLPCTDEAVRNVLERSLNTLKIKALLRNANKRDSSSVMLPSDGVPSVSPVSTVTLPTAHGKTVFARDRIIYCKAQNKETLLRTAEEQSAIAVYLLLKSVGERLAEIPDENDFLRVHASYIVNRRHIQHIKPRKSKDKGLLLTMSNGDEVPVSETFKKDFLKAFEGLEFKGK
jgi:DNA-binding LytR/AlgR family response regulator